VSILVLAVIGRPPLDLIL